MGRFRNLLMFFIVALYSSHASQFFFNLGMTSIKPLYWHFLTITIALGFAISKLPRIPDIPTQLSLWMLIYLGNSIVSFLYSSQGEIELQALTDTFVMISLLLSFLVIFQENEAMRISRLALFFVTMFAVSMNIIDFLLATFTKIPGRSAGLYLNPTIAGKMLVMIMVLSVTLIHKRLRLLYCLFVGIGVLVTFSRGPWFLWGLAMAGLALGGYFESRHKSISIAFISLFAGLILYNALTGGVLEIMVATGLDSYLTQDTIIRLGGHGGAFLDYSTVSRMDAALKAWHVFANNPWLGAGLGIDQNWLVGSHNTYLRMAAEGGVIRLVIFVGLIVMLWRLTDSIGKVALIVYAASCFTSQDNLRQPALLLLLALISLIQSKHYSVKRKSDISTDYHVSAVHKPFRNHTK